MTKSAKSQPESFSAPSPKGRPPRNSLIGVAIVLILLSLIFANNTFRDLKTASKYETWSRATATVVECSDQSTGVFPTGERKDTQDVTCQFSTAGRIVRSHFWSKGWKYHKGDQVEMRFNPFSPNMCAVNPIASGKETLINAIIFAVFFISGFGLLLYALKRARKSTGAQVRSAG
jgi:hypothetical protein